MLRSVVPATLLCIGLCHPASAQSLAQFDGKYLGELTLTKVVRGDCTKPPLGSLYPLTISNGQVRFEYVPRFGTTLTGRINEAGVFKAAARLRKGRLVEMTGRVQGGIHLTAVIYSPSCNYSFQTRN